MSCSSAASAKGAPLKPLSSSRSPLEAERGQPRQRRQDTRPVVRVGRMQLEIEQRTVLVANHEELDALDQLAAIEAPRPGARGGAERAAVDHHCRGQDLIAAS